MPCAPAQSWLLVVSFAEPGSSRVSVPAPKFEANTYLSETATSRGSSPSGKSRMTLPSGPTRLSVLAACRTTQIESNPNATPSGSPVSATVVTTWLDAGSMATTRSAPNTVAHTSSPSNATRNGVSPTSTFADTSRVAGSMRQTASPSAAATQIAPAPLTMPIGLATPMRCVPAPAVGDAGAAWASGSAEPEHAVSSRPMARREAHARSDFTPAPYGPRGDGVHRRSWSGGRDARSDTRRRPHGEAVPLVGPRGARPGVDHAARGGPAPARRRPATAGPRSARRPTVDLDDAAGRRPDGGRALGAAARRARGGAAPAVVGAGRRPTAATPASRGGARGDRGRARRGGRDPAGPSAGRTTCA